MNDSDSAVYWRRRGAAIAVVVALALFMLWAFSGPSQPAADDQAVPEFTTTGAQPLRFDEATAGEPVAPPSGYQVPPTPAPQPGLPEAPAGTPQPGLPAGSVQPGTPSVLPDGPAAAPGIPASPGTLGTAGVPGAPGTPGTLGAPGTSAAPGALAVPGTPAAPGSAVAPGSAAAAPGGPAAPGSLGPQAGPGARTAAGAPAVPGGLPAARSANPSVAGPAQSPGATPGAAANPGATPGTAATPGSETNSGTAATPGTANSTRQQAQPPVMPCPDQMISVLAQVEPKSFKVGVKPRFKLMVANIGDKPCTRDLDAGLQEMVVTGGPKQTRIWSSNDCFPAKKANVRLLQPGKPQTFAVEWAGRTSNPGCSGPRAAAGPGAYQLVAKLGSLSSGPTPFTITG